MKTLPKLLCLTFAFSVFASVVSAEAEYGICITVPDETNAGTDDDLYVKIISTQFETKRIHLDLPGDDNNRNTRSCFWFSARSHAGSEMRDMVIAEFLLQGDDDICISNVYIRTIKNRRILDEFEMDTYFCLGDDAPTQGMSISEDGLYYIPDFLLYERPFNRPCTETFQRKSSGNMRNHSGVVHKC